MAFKLRSGNKLSFKSMGSSPAKQEKEKWESYYPLTEEEKNTPTEEELDQEKIDQQIKGTYIQTEEDIKKRKEGFEKYAPRKKAPTKQVKTKGLGPRTAFGGVKNPELTKTKKPFSTKVMKDGPKKQVTGIDLGKDPNWQPHPNTFTTPNKQIELAMLRKRKGLGPREIQGEDDQSYEAAVTRKEMGMTKQYPYYYEINGQKVSKDAYIKYKNKPGGDESGKQTNDPDVYGKNANNHGRGKKTK